jgi:hypothetical protein
MNIPIDKQAHFWWGMAIAGIAFPFGFWVALFLSCFFGATKEIYDLQGHGTPDPKDFAATALGGLVGCLALAAIHAASSTCM